MFLTHLPLWLPLSLLLLSLIPFFLKTTQNRRRPPGPPWLPIIGNLHQLGALPHSSMRRLAQIYGPVMRLRLGRIQTTVISSAKAAQELMKTHDLHSCSRPKRESSRKLSYNFLDVAFSPYSDYWREMRKLCVLELFSVRRVKSYQSIREEEVGSLIKFVSECACSQTAVDLSDKMTALTASIVFRIAFGKRFEARDSGMEKFQELVNEAEAMLGSYSASELYFPVAFVGKIMDRVSGRHGRLERVWRELDNLFQKVIDEHLDPNRQKPEEDDIIDVLLAVMKDQASITHQNIKALLLNIFLGGIDTGSITLVWAMAELAKNPKLMKKAQQQLRNYAPNKQNITETDTDELPYLKMIVKETLRLHPPAPLLLPREAISHFTIQGYHIPPKTQLQVNFWAIGRDPKYWTNPDDFIPERFADTSIDYKGQHFELLPFGAGRRSCPAMYMGAKTVELALANLLYSFDWKLPEGMSEDDLNMEETAGHSLTVFKKVPLKLVPVRPPKNL